jgi:thiol-disulfide isomerase/thioredoxin
MRRRQRHTVRWVAIAAAMTTAALGVAIAVNVGTDPLADSKRRHLLGQDAPNFDLPALDSGRTRLADLRGKVLIINFWNSWCSPCRQEHSNLVHFFGEHARHSLRPGDLLPNARGSGRDRATWGDANLRGWLRPGRPSPLRVQAADFSRVTASTAIETVMEQRR